MIIVGSGLIAKALDKIPSNDDFLIFASGVSDSCETREVEFQREIDLIQESLQRNKKLIYFSSLDVVLRKDKFNSYLRHKLNVEKILEKKSAIVLRLPQLVGSRQNKKNLIPYLYNKIVNKKEFELKINYLRNLVDINDLSKIVECLIKKNNYSEKYLNIFNPKFIKILDIIRIIERLSNTKAIYTISEESFEINNLTVSDEYLSFLKESSVEFHSLYNIDLIKKYFFN